MYKIDNDPAVNQGTGKRPAQLEAVITGILQYMLDHDSVAVQDQTLHFSADTVQGFLERFKSDLSYVTKGPAYKTTNALYWAVRNCASHSVTAEGLTTFDVLTHYAISSGQKLALIYDNGLGELPLHEAIKSKKLSQQRLLGHLAALIGAGVQTELSRVNIMRRTVWHEAVDGGYNLLPSRLEPFCGVGETDRNAYMLSKTARPDRPPVSLAVFLKLLKP